MKAGGKIASVYASAMLEIAREQKKLEDFEETLQSLATSFQADSTVWKFFSAPITPSEAKLKLIDKFLKSQLDASIYNFLRVLAVRKRMDQLPGVAAAYSHLLDEELNRRRVTVESAQQLAEGQKGDIEKAMGSYLNAKKVVMEVRENPDLIGGVVIRSGDILIDTSIKSALSRMRAGLLKQKTIGEEFYEN